MYCRQRNHKKTGKCHLTHFEKIASNKNQRNPKTCHEIPFFGSLFWIFLLLIVHKLKIFSLHILSFRLLKAFTFIFWMRQSFRNICCKSNLLIFFHKSRLAFNQILPFLINPTLFASVASSTYWVTNSTVDPSLQIWKR